MTTRPHEFTTDEIHELLSDLDERLRARGIAAAIFVVGGAAIAASGARDGRVTQDVDALTRSVHVVEEARLLAAARGLPSTWLNVAASMWMPPLPPGVLDAPDEPGLRITYAADDFLLATKLVAQRAKDADDLLALARRLGLHRPSSESLEAHIRAFYTDLDALALIVDGGNVDRELRFLAEDAAALLSRETGGDPR